MASKVYMSPADDRDYPVTAGLDISGDAIPEDFAVWQPPTFEDQQAGNCVAQALANIMECIDYQESGQHKDYSVGYIYGTPLNTVETNGMYPREAVKSLLKEGDVLREVWECDDENPLCRIKRGELSQEVHKLAKKISAFVRLHTKEEMQRYMLRYKLPVLIVAPMSAYWFGEGLHATACYGWLSEKTYDRDYGYAVYKDLRYTNSWGEFMGRGIIESSQILEMWGVIPMEKEKFTDTEGHWAEKFIEHCRDLGLINGYEDNSVRPENGIKRGEACKMFSVLADKLDDRLRKIEEMLKISAD